MGGATAAIVVGVGLKAYGDYRGLRSAEARAKYDAQINRSNIKIIEEQIKDVRTLGKVAEKEIEQQAVEFIGEQVSAFASSGIDISSAVVGEVTEETARKAAADIVTTQKNIERDIWGLQIGKMNEASQLLFNKARARSAGKLAPIAAGATLLTGVSGLSLRTGKPPPPASQKSPLRRIRLPRKALPPTFNITDNPFA
jgi:hypothetical protein